MTTLLTLIAFAVGVACGVAGTYAWMFWTVLSSQPEDAP